MFTHSVMYNSLQPHGLLPSPSPSPRACSNSCSLSEWCHPTILSSVIPFSSHLQSFPASGSFLMSQSLISKYSLEGVMLKLKLQYFGHLMQRADSFEMALMLGKIEGRRRRGWQRTRWLDGITHSMDVSLSKLWERWRTGKPGMLQSMGSQRLSNWTN